MEDIRREKRMFNTQVSEKIPLISFRYSKDVAENKVSVRFMHPTRAEIYVHLQGDCTFFVGDRVHRLSYGDILIYNKDEVHFNNEPTVPSLVQTIAQKPKRTNTGACNIPT